MSHFFFTWWSCIWWWNLFSKIQLIYILLKKRNNIYQKLPFFKKKVKKAPSIRSFQNQKRTIFLFFKKAVIYTLSTKKNNIKK